MRIDKLTISNFKCFDSLELTFHPSFNVMLGNNGTGKTSILEALRIAMGSLYLGLDKYEDRIVSPSIIDDDVRLYNMEQQYPTRVTAEGLMSDYNNTDISELSLKWTRSLESRGGKTLYKDAKDMLTASKSMQKSIRNNSEKIIPLVAYFSTDRYKKEKRDVKVEPNGSRLRGYYNSLDATTNSKYFLNLLYTETLDQTQTGNKSILLQILQNAICSCLDCKSIIYILKEKELFLEYNDGQKTPFHLLSDGVRCTLAMIMEIAVRCYLLNPQLGVDAAMHTNGIILIDELDLHLHPSWQRHIAKDLRKTFQRMQFIVTTHAPLIISELSDCRIYSIANGDVFDFPLQNGRDANYILQQMHVPHINTENENKIKQYMALIEKGLGKEEDAMRMRNELERILGKDHAELQRADMMLSFF